MSKELASARISHFLDIGIDQKVSIRISQINENKLG